jgi:RimJ/RimL family protein N-acetyltransferase
MPGARAAVARLEAATDGPSRVRAFSFFMVFLTPRLRLRCLDARDAGALVAHLNDWEVARWLSQPPYPYSAEDAKAFISVMRERHRQPNPLLFAIAERALDAAIGVIGIEPDETDSGELGYWIGRPFWGQGYGREAAAAAIAQAADAGLRRLVAFAHPENLRSLRLLQRCGFRPAGEAARSARSGEVTMRRLTLELSRDGIPRSGAAPA